MLISNLEFLPDRTVQRHLGLVQGSSVRSKHVGRDIMASVKNIFGGELKGYTELLQDSREEATSRMLDRARRESMLRMKEAARNAGASFVFNVKYSTANISTGSRTAAMEVLVYGTAMIARADSVTGQSR